MSENKTISEQFNEQFGIIKENEALKENIEAEKQKSETERKKAENLQRKLGEFGREKERISNELKEITEKYRQSQEAISRLQSAAEKKAPKRKGRAAWSLVKLLFVVILCASIVYYYETELEREEDRIKEAESELSELRLKNIEYQERADFMDEYVRVVERTTGIYHKYGCEDLSLNRFLIYNSSAVESKDYTPCPLCIGESEPEGGAIKLK